MSIDPIRVSERIEDEYRSYLRSSFPIADPALNSDFDHQLRGEFKLAKGPLLEATPPYETGARLSDLVNEGVLSSGFLDFSEEALPLDRRLYLHQEQAIRSARSGRNLLIATGTGSGKTECFLLPIIDALLRERETGTLAKPGVRALLLYPMNALANDQLKRLRVMLKDFPDITFGRYTGETQQTEKKAENDFRSRYPGQHRLPNELISRDEINEEPPRILLTNYAMLEYLLLRPSASRLFDGPTGKHWRFLALDEIHVYGGSAGTEIGLLLRRVRERVLGDSGRHFQCFGTSATLGDGEKDYPDLTAFAEQLFNEPFEWNPPEQRDVIGATRKSLTRSDAKGELNLSDYQRLAEKLESEGESAPSDVADELVQDQRVVQLQEKLARGPVDMREVAGQLFPGPDAASNLTRLIDLGVKAGHRSDDSPVLPARYHFFLRALEGAYLCLHPDHPESESRLLLSRHQRCPICEEAGVDAVMFEFGACRHCGSHYVVGNIDDSHFGHARPTDEQPVRALVGTPFDDEQDDDEDEASSESAWAAERALEATLCAGCGTFSEGPGLDRCECDSPPASQTVWVSMPAREQGTTRQCIVCAKRESPDPVRRFFAGADAPVSVVATDLYQELPPSKEVNTGMVAAGRKLLAFSDSRQEAAFFAPYLDRTYNRAIQRRLIYQALDQFGDRAPHSDQLALKLRQLAEDAGVLDPQRENSATAQTWVMREILAMDRRQSLEGTGVAQISLSLPPDLELPPAVEKLGFDAAEYRSLLAVLFDITRSQGAVEPLGDVDLRDEVFSPRNRSFGVRERESDFHTVGWLPGRGSNRRLDFVKRLFAKREVDVDPSEFMRDLWIRVLTSGDPAWNERFRKSDRSDGTVWKISPDWLAFKLGVPERLPWRCSDCGQLWWHSISRVCPGYRCEGELTEADDPNQLLENHYVRLYRNLKPIGMEAQEHTAQWNNKKASSIQQDFTEGKVNVLSCSTTFELGVDVGEVEAVLLRNVPPHPANYIQRAGRAGRRTDSAALVVTFAQMRSHDLNYFKQPEMMVGGKIPPPRVVLENVPIARRHMHSVAFAAYLREVGEVKTVGEFFNPDEGKPPADDFIDWLTSRPEELGESLKLSVPESLHGTLELDSWRWVEALSEEQPENTSTGWFQRAAQQVRGDVRIVRDLMLEAAESENFGLAKRLKHVRSTIENRRLIEFLAAHNILPKYGFPVDVVGLSLNYDQTQGADELELDRDLKLAIVDYAPGSVTVAGKKLWQSVGLARGAEESWRAFGWAVCEGCGNFRQALEEAPSECAACGSTKKAQGRNGRYILPEFGFIGKGIGDAGGQRPRRMASTEFHFGDYPHEHPEAEPVEGLPDEASKVFGRQGMITVINMGPAKRGFLICNSCGFGEPVPAGKPKARSADQTHKRPWDGKECRGYLSMNQLGHNFLTDVVQLRPGFTAASHEELRSTLYALLAAVPDLDIPREDVDGALHWVGKNQPAFVIFDAVPGGAGHAKRLSSKLPELVEAAYRKASDCECGAETSCYSCLRSYNNQLFHDELTRQAAMDVLGKLRG